MVSSLESLFSPKSVAIIGASSNPSRTGYQFTKELIDTGYVGEIYPINPKGGVINGYQIYCGIDEIDKEIDLAILLVNKDLVEKAVIDCANHGVKVSVIYSAGYGEIEGSGKEVQKKLVELAQSKGMRIVGPNCAGVFSSSIGLNLTGEPVIPPGKIGFISQSGGIGFSAWYDAAHYLKTGFSKFIGFGNQADVPIHEYLEYLGSDSETEVIVLYIEGILPGMGKKFLEVAKKITPHKPIVAIKGGRTNAGTRAAASHTGALAGAFEIYRSAFKQAGIIEVDRLDELIPVAQTLLECPPLISENIALIGAGGGHMILSSDAVERNGFHVPSFSEETELLLKEKLYYFAPKKNPVDLAGSYVQDLRIWEDVIRIALQEPGIGGVMLYGAYGSYFPDLMVDGETWETISHRLGKIQKEIRKPILAYTVAARENIPSINALRNGGIPTFDSLEVTARCLRALQEYGQIQQNSLQQTVEEEIVGGNSSPETLLLEAISRTNRNLTEPEAYRLLETYSIPIVKYQFAQSDIEAAVSSASIGYPVVMKLCSPDIIHKSDIGGVEVNLSSEIEVKAAFQRMIQTSRMKAPQANIQGVVIASQEAGVEIIAGIYRDVQFGPVLMVGLGGIFVETLRDVAFRVLPVTETEIFEMLKELKGYPLLTGSRGRKPVNINALVKLLYQLSKLVLSNPIISEIDLNPIFVNEDGAKVADARIIVSPVSEGVEVVS